MLSVVIPIYNIEKWLWQCLDSVVGQSYTNLQIILVDDGSTDNCPAICDEYASKDPRIEVIHKTNGGLSDARNAGINTAKGDYIFFLDGDDWIHKEALNVMMLFALENNCDITQCAHWYASNTALEFEYRFLSDSKKPFTIRKEEAMRQLLLNKYFKNFAWGKLYRTELVKKHYFEKGKYFEDSYWQHLIIDEASKIGIIPQPYYFYRQRNTSISSSVSNKNFDLIRGVYNRFLFIDQNYTNLLGIASRKLWKAIWGIENAMKYAGDKVLFSEFNDIKKNILLENGHRFNRYCWWNYRYLCSRYIPQVRPFLSYFERFWDYFFVPDLRRDSAQYDSINDIINILKKYQVNIKSIEDCSHYIIIDCYNEKEAIAAILPKRLSKIGQIMCGCKYLVIVDNKSRYLNFSKE